MKDIHPDILASAYAAVDGVGLKGNRDVLALIVAQAMQSERDRACAHVSRAKDAIRESGDGSVANVRLAAMGIVDAAVKAIVSGEAA